jgi:hypothetical protein
MEEERLVVKKVDRSAPLLFAMVFFLHGLQR